MPSDFDLLLDEMEESGIDPDYIDRLKKASAGSPLRKRNQELETRLQELETRDKDLEAKVLTATLDKVGVKIKPAALRFPDDLDVSDEDKVSAWAVESGLIEAKPDVPEGELQTHDKVTKATAGGESADTGTVTPEKITAMSKEDRLRFRQNHPDAWAALKRGETVRGINI